MSHDITPDDIGVRVRAVSRNEGTGATITFEGPVTYVTDVVRGFEVAGAYVYGSDTGAKSSWTLTVERSRPAVPTLPNAVVRLDGPDGPTAWLAHPNNPDGRRWVHELGWPLTGADIAARIAPNGVLFPGVEQ